MKTTICHAGSFIILCVCAIALAVGCGRKAERLAPCGWEATGKPSDSLLVLLDRSIYSYCDPDSLDSLVERYVKVSGEEDPDGIYEHRRLYWQGTALFGHGEFERGDSLRRLAMQRCDSSRFPHDYRLYRLATEQPTDFPDNASRYKRYLSDLKVFEAEGDLVSAFSRSVLLSQLMSEAGMHREALDYVLLADSVLKKADLPLLRINNEVNVASCLFNAGDTVGAVRALDEVKAHIGGEGNEGVEAIIDFNKYEMTGDTAALAAAWRIVKGNPDLARMQMLVGASLVKSDMQTGDYGYIMALLKEADAYAFRPEEELSIKEAILDLSVDDGNVALTRDAAYGYEAAVERYLNEQKKGEVISAQISSMINEVSLDAEREKQRSRNILWTVLAVVGVVVAVGVICGVMYINRNRRILLLTQLEIERHRRQQIATDLMLAERADREPEIKTIADDEAIDDMDGRFMKLFVARYPKVRKTGRRLALYIWKGKDTSDIARIMSIRKESVMQARWRLRSQMDLAPEEDLEVIIHQMVV